MKNNYLSVIGFSAAMLLTGFACSDDAPKKKNTTSGSTSGTTSGTTGGPGNCTTDQAKFALLTGGSSKTWKKISQNGNPTPPYCENNYDTETFTSDKNFTQRTWFSPCTPNDISAPFLFCGDRIYVAHTPNNYQEKSKVISITESKMVVEWIGEGDLPVTEEYVPN